MCDASSTSCRKIVLICDDAKWVPGLMLFPHALQMPTMTVGSTTAVTQPPDERDDQRRSQLDEGEGHQQFGRRMPNLPKVDLSDAGEQRVYCQRVGVHQRYSFQSSSSTTATTYPPPALATQWAECRELNSIANLRSSVQESSSSACEVHQVCRHGSLA